MKQNILIVDDDEGILSALKLLLRRAGYLPITANSPEQALSALRYQDFGVILMDLNYSSDTTSGDEGIALIKAVRQIDELIPIVVMTGWGSIAVAVSTMKNGANDFVQKPWENDRLLAIIKNQTTLTNIQKQSQKLSEQNQLLRDEISPVRQIIANSATMKNLLATLTQIAKSDVSVLLTGENGTGKSLLARFIHDHSARKHAAQISVNMGAVTESLFESEMFGHVKGAFTDAKSNRIGRFELADDGTLFLDEIANTPFSQQAKLLRVLEDSQFEKVGSSRTQTVNVRLITATNADLELAVQDGLFRKDLYYRINTIALRIPPLRERIDDIMPLAQAFLQQVAKKYGQPPLTIDDKAELALISYAWPGNVRELGHVMERAQVLCQGSRIQTQDLGLNPDHNNSQFEASAYGANSTGNDLRPMHEIEADIILKRLAYFDGDAEQAAQSLGMTRSTFYRQWKNSKTSKHS